MLFPGPHGHRSTVLLATAFDPLAAARDLKAAGFEQEQAEALAAQLRVAAGADHAELATKADLAEFRAATKADLAELRAATKADLAEHRAATAADLAEIENRLTNTLAMKADKADLAGLRAELGTIRWTVGLIAAFLFAIGLRVFGVI